MKIKQEHYEVLKQGMDKVNKLHPGAKIYYADKGLSAMRFRWDCLHCAERMGSVPSDFICKVLYKYLDDTHIDTALKSITASY